MLTPNRTVVAASRYETFVIRLWVNPDAVVEYGEIRHIASNRSVRFRDIERALTFITGVITGDAAHVDDPQEPHREGGEGV